MSAVTWSLQSGDRRRLAWRLALVDDPAGGDDAVSAAARASWGLFELWVDGVNLCAHDEQGEQLTAAHWYLLPMAEWLVANWNPLFHEQGMPLPDIGGAAATAARASTLLDSSPDRVPERWGLPAGDGGSHLGSLQTWAMRHRLASAAPEAVLPEVWLRRVDGDLEVSLGDADTSLFDGAVSWAAPRRAARVPVAEAARVTERAVRSLLAELVDRGLATDTAAELLLRFDAALAPGRDDDRLAWLVGLRGDTGALEGLRDSLDELDPSGGAPDKDRRRGVLEAVPVAMLFGSLSPDVTKADVAALVSALRGADRPAGLHGKLDALAGAADPSDYGGLPPGEAGGELGDAVAALLPQQGGQVEIARYMTETLGITFANVPLSDPAIRAVTLIHEDGRAVVAVNSAYQRGSAAHVRRFTLAHELAHLVYDRASAGRLAIASGPWTPERVEQRANGFAAAVLMPETLLREHTAQQPGWAADPSALAGTAKKLGVGVTALANRLHNVGMLSRDAADGLVDALAT